MKKLLFLSLCMCISTALSAQTATNVVAKQVGSTVEITYDLDKTAIVSLLLSSDGGASYSNIPQSLTGDVGIVNGGRAKKIVWNLFGDGEDWDIERARFRIETQGASELTFTLGDMRFTMVQVEAGELRSSKVDEFHIGKIEVTQALWKAVMGGDNPSAFVADDGPVDNVSWIDCQEFIRQLNKIFAPQLGGKVFALPTEKQWEFAASGGNARLPLEKRYSGSDFIGAVAWFAENSGRKTHKAGTKMANELGLYDMSGNVWEWCGQEGEICAVRGGSWADGENECRTNSRHSYSPDQRMNTYGLRLVLVSK